ncbi:hypothetical protein PUR34_29315 [Streptomyces sp. JV185]|uniref:hypothetical protein n=1 Tax=Streptomyces sp. JV185 TaxID=858638 RepID=UPI002E77EEAA|nr:hypothetical protein [Streptomyces sp. JV185]MEE1772150.1 hypothetical protein [Streptomyces sp. JV185]
MAGRVVPAAGGWGPAQRMGEPSATGGPEPASARPSGPDGEPGPQPEPACDDAVGHSARRPAAPAPRLPASATPVDGGTARLTQVICVRAEVAGRAD